LQGFIPLLSRFEESHHFKGFRERGDAVVTGVCAEHKKKEFARGELPV
jgi:hypothetical protein